MRNSYSALGVALIVVAALLIVLALVRDGNSAWLALVGVACALAGAAVGAMGRTRAR
jgi:membrane-bound ClpP family serine protease